MKIKLDRPLISFDLETTGKEITKDRIVQLAARKYSADGQQEDDINLFINPGIPISPEATEVHGITDRFVSDQPTFEFWAPQILEFFAGCDLLGYNSNRFDIPLLAEEFSRVGIVWPDPANDTQFLDGLRLEQICNPHTLAAAYERATGKPLEGAHEALADVAACGVVVDHLVASFADLLPDNVKDLAALCQGDNPRVDLAGKICLIDGVECWAFGKHQGHPVSKSYDYAKWVMSKDFPGDTKRHVKRIMSQSTVNNMRKD